MTDVNVLSTYIDMDSIRFVTITFPKDFDQMITERRAQCYCNGSWRRIVRYNQNRITVELDSGNHQTLDLGRGISGPLSDPTHPLRILPPQPPEPFKQGFPPHSRLCLLLEREQVHVGRYHASANVWVVLSQQKLDGAVMPSGQWCEISIVNVRGWCEFQEVFRV